MRHSMASRSQLDSPTPYFNPTAGGGQEGVSTDRHGPLNLQSAMVFLHRSQWFHSPYPPWFQGEGGVR
jgi:hypothetical protein